MNGYSKQTFEAADSDTKLNILFDCVLTIHSKIQNQSDIICPQRIAECELRFKKIEHTRWWNTAASACGGVIGGAVAMVGKYWISK